MDEKMTFRNWLPLIGLTAAAFIFNTSEFIPIGLLSDIAADFGVTEARAGMLISVYAWIVMLLSLPLMMLASGMELRRLLLAVIALFTLCQFGSSLSTSYALLMASRIGVACTHAIFWSIVSPVAVRIVPARFAPLALSMIVTGTSVAMIFGLPLGRIVGLHVGWRMTFLGIGGFSSLVGLYLLLDLPHVPSRGGFSLHKLPELLRNRHLMRLYLLSLAIATSYYTAYSYIEPFLKQTARLGESWITATLMIFGASGIAGSLLFSKYHAARPQAFLAASLTVIAACLLLLTPAAVDLRLVIPLCALWGMAVTAFNVTMQADVIDNTAQEATPVAMSIFSGIFNLGIGCGTLIGGAVCTHDSLAHVGYAGGAIAAAALWWWGRGIVRQRMGRCGLCIRPGKR